MPFVLLGRAAFAALGCPGSGDTGRPKRWNMLNRSRVSRSLLATAAATAAVTAAALGFGSSAGATSGPSHSAAGAAGSGLYVVQMVGDPLATAAATRPA